MRKLIWNGETREVPDEFAARLLEQAAAIPAPEEPIRPTEAEAPATAEERPAPKGKRRK